MKRIGLLLGLVALVLAAGIALINGVGDGGVSARALVLPLNQDTTGFARALGAWDWQFPRDHGAHPDFQTEWWYFTGNLAADDGRRFGFQFTIFRRAILPTPPGADDSEWRANQMYMAHVSLSDVGGGQFFHDARYSRGAAGLAGAAFDPLWRVWLENWQVAALDAAVTGMQVTADAGAFALDLTLTRAAPPVLQGDGGLSAKSADPGNASYYYSLTRLPAQGTLRVGDTQFTVTGAAWMDHEFSTSALAADAQGWDWFGLQLDDGRALMLGDIRLTGGGKEPAFSGMLVSADGATQVLPSDSFSITPMGTWTSPHTGAVYPSGWTMVVTPPDGSAPLRLTLTPLLLDQEVHGGTLPYWEGAVRIGGDATGYGYAELTGYAQAMTGRF